MITQRDHPDDSRAEFEDVDLDAASEAAVSALSAVVEALPEGRRRQGQEMMCAAVARSSVVGEHIVASAQTGTGKSLAYMVPAVSQRRKVVVATSTKALQDQLLHHDVPMIEQGLGESVTAVTLKGRSNYLCRQKLSELMEVPKQDRLDFAPAMQRRKAGEELERLHRWASTTETGDKAELDFEPSSRLWQNVSVDSSECPGASKCDSGMSCFAEKAIAKADNADIVIVNLHMYLLSVSTPLIPDHSLVVIDEAHALEETASSCFGASLTPRRCYRIAERVNNYFDNGAQQKNCMAFTDAVNALFAVLGRYESEEIQVPLPHDIASTGSAVLNALESLRAAVKHDLAELEEAQASTHLAIDTEDSNPDDNKRVQFLRRLSKSVQQIGAEMSSFLNASEETAMWVEQDRSEMTWRMAPIDVSVILRHLLWENRTAVLSSATIPTNFAAAWGLPEGEFAHVEAESPFDYKANGLLYVPQSMPKPGSGGYDDALHDEMEALIRLAGGRTLALFSSWKALNEAARQMSERLPYRILNQKDLPKPELLKQFAAEPETCLFGTLGLWQGVDVPGESLSMVIVARLPFPRPDDPLLQARRRMHGNKAFMGVDVPLVATRLAQGSGRLIRSETDRGVVAVLDSRLVNARYGSVIWGALPPFSRTTKRADVEKFLERTPTAA